MGDIRKDDLSPDDKDPAEGARGGNEGAAPMPPSAERESHLGAGGDPAEGKRRDTTTGGETGPAA